MKNYVQEGEVLELTAPYARLSGEGALIGAIFGVPVVDVAAGARASFGLTGVYDLKKTSAQAWTEGQKIYWDNTAKETTSTVGANVLIGIAAEVAVNPSAVGRVRLNGTA